MLIDPNEYIHRVNGIPLYYNGLTPIPYHPAFINFHPTPAASPPYKNYGFLMSKFTSPQNTPLILTPPISPVPEPQIRRGSVIMKVENCQIFPTNEVTESPIISVEHCCKWQNCYKIFESLESLANHVSVAHSSVGPNNLYYCNWEGCQRSDRGFNARYKMLVHCRTHTKEKPHLCTFNGCQKAFSRAENLKIHVRSHTLEKPYKCNFSGCIKSYSNSSDRFKHSRTHQNNKPYCCKVPGCLKRYTDPSSLRKHVKTFNHDHVSLIQSQEKTDESMDCQLSAHHDTITTHHSPDKLYFDAISYSETLETKDGVCWMRCDNELADKMETIRLDQHQPLDLSIRHNR